MGKRSSFERIPRDLYDTPPAAVEALLPYLAPGTEFAEPCAGNGALIDLLTVAGHRCVWATDIKPGREDIGTLNAMTLPQLGRQNVRAPVIITNPPWTRSILHPLIDRLSAVWPCWFLFDADWVYTRQSADLILRCSRIVPIGRLKWMPGTKHVGKDNSCWYEFLPGHTEGPHLLPRGTSSYLHNVMMGPEERQRAIIKASGRVADPGPLFDFEQYRKWICEGKTHATQEIRSRQLPSLPAPAPTEPQAAAPDAGSPPDSKGPRRHGDSAELSAVQSGQGIDDGRAVGGVRPSTSSLLAKLRSGLRPMVYPRITPGALDGGD